MKGFQYFRFCLLGSLLGIIPFSSVNAAHRSAPIEPTVNVENSNHSLENAHKILPDYLALQQRVQEVFQQKSGAVVRVVGFFPRDEGVPITRIGTGFFIRSDGYIITSASAVLDAKEVLVEYGASLPNSSTSGFDVKQNLSPRFAMFSANAQVVGVDVMTNLAVLKIQPECEIETFNLGTTMELPATGTFLVGTSCELGLSVGPSLGMVVGRESGYGDIYFATTYLRSDIPTSGGEPGSPIFDLEGNFIGVMIASISNVRSSFILPARAVRRITSDILLYGNTRYAYVGLNTKLQRDEKGAYIVSIDGIQEGSPAQLAHLLIGDRILAINQIPLSNLGDLHDAIFFAQPDAMISFKVLRNKEILNISVKTQSRTYPLSE